MNPEKNVLVYYYYYYNYNYYYLYNKDTFKLQEHFFKM